MLTPLCLIIPCGPVGRQAYASLMGYRVPAHLPNCSWLTSPGNRFPKTPRVTVENAGRLGRQGLCPIYLCVLTQSRLREWVMCYFTRKETEAQGDESCDLPQLTQLEME